jgi:hypothetical protein
MQQHHRSVFVALVFLAMIAAPRAQAADPVPAGDRAAADTSAALSRLSRAPVPEGQATVLLAPSFALDGIWMFDAAHSDDPMKVMQASRPQGGAGGEGGPPMGGGMGGGRRGGGGPGMGRGGDDAAGGDHPDQPAENRPRGPSPMSRVLRPAKKLVIDMQADQAVLTEDENAARPYAIADSLKAHGHELLTENTSAQWKSGKLEMTQVMGQRGKLVETYEVSHDGKTLTIRARREGGREGMPNPILTRVYTRYDGE